jgi:uncharacterized membrane protein YdfJ with MMPL/SSD domain
VLSRLANLAIRRPKRVIAAGAIFLVVGGAIGGGVFSVLKPFGFDDPASESIIARDRLSQASGVESQPGVVALVRSAKGVDSPAARRLIARSQGLLKADPQIVRTSSILDGPNPNLVSRDRRSTYVQGFLAAGTGDDVKDKAAKRLLKQFAPLAPAVKLGGIAVAYEQIGHQVEGDLQKAELLAFPILFLLCFWVFRGLIAAALPPLIGILSIVGALLGLRIAAEFGDFSVFAVNVTTAMGLGLAIDYSLFVLSRYREELALVGPGVSALRRTMRTAGRTVMFSGMTVAAALASLVVFPQRFLYSMGVGGALVSLLAALISLTVLPAILFLLGDRVNALAPKALQRRAVQAARPATDGFWFRLSKFVMRRPIAVATVAAAAMLALGSPFLGVKFTFADARVLPASASAHQVNDTLNAEFPPNSTDPIQIEVEPGAKPSQLSAFAAKVRKLDRVTTVTPPQPVGHGVWAVNVFYRGDHFSDPVQRLVRQVRATPHPFEMRVTGGPARLIDQNRSLLDHLPEALALIAAATLIVLFLMTGSVILPVKALVMNLLTISAAFGVLVLVFQDGRFENLLAYTGTGGLDSSNAMLLFAIAFGLSTDYGVFLLTRIKEARDGGASERDSVAIGMERTGRLVTAAAMLLCVALLAFATSKIIFIKEFSIGAAAAVAVDATIVRALLVPSLMRLLGRWNWWAPRPLRRLHERAGLTETA